MKTSHLEKPFECAYCSHYYISRHYFILTLQGGEQFGICEKCRFDVTCDRCGKKLKRHELFLEECTICEKIYLTCARCRIAKPSLFTRIKDSLKRTFYAWTPFGITVCSQTVQCCISKSERPVVFSGIFYLKKAAQEGSDRDDR